METILQFEKDWVLLKKQVLHHIAKKHLHTTPSHTRPGERLRRNRSSSIPLRWFPHSSPSMCNPWCLDKPPMTSNEVESQSSILFFPHTKSLFTLVALHSCKPRFHQGKFARRQSRGDSDYFGRWTNWVPRTSSFAPINPHQVLLRYDRAVWTLHSVVAKIVLRNTLTSE